MVIYWDWKHWYTHLYTPALSPKRAWEGGHPRSSEYTWHPELFLSLLLSRKTRGLCEPTATVKAGAKGHLVPKARKCSKNDRDMAKGHRGQLKGACTSQLRENFNFKIHVSNRL